MRPLAKIKTFVERYEHQLSIGSFLVGFATDTILLKRIDLLVSNALLLTYLSVAVGVMLVLHAYAGRQTRYVLVQKILSWVPFVGQFAFGGMFSGFLIFYSQSGSLVTSWPFLLIIIGLIIGNEFLRSYQSRLTYQCALLFFCLFTFSIYALPIFLGRMGDDVFELSGALALLVSAGLLSLLFFIDQRRVRLSLGHIVLSVLSVYALVTSLYFANVVPPIPLALKDMGIYHSLMRSGDGYVVTEEAVRWYERVAGVTVHSIRGAPLFAYSSVFAPTKLTTHVVHRWEHYGASGWETRSTIPFGISGGRDGGYRGYSVFPVDEAGTWRVSVETARGQLIGREEFQVVFVMSTAMTIERILR